MIRKSVWLERIIEDGTGGSLNLVKELDASWIKGWTVKPCGVFSIEVPTDDVVFRRWNEFVKV